MPKEKTAATTMASKRNRPIKISGENPFFFFSSTVYLAYSGAFSVATGVGSTAEDVCPAAAEVASAVGSTAAGVASAATGVASGAISAAAGVAAGTGSAAGSIVTGVGAVSDSTFSPQYVQNTS